MSTPRRWTLHVVPLGGRSHAVREDRVTIPDIEAVAERLAVLGSDEFETSEARNHYLAQAQEILGLVLGSPKEGVKVSEAEPMLDLLEGVVRAATRGRCCDGAGCWREGETALAMDTAEVFLREHGRLQVDSDE